MCCHYLLYLQVHGISTVDNYNYKNNLNWTSNDTTVSKHQLFNAATYSFNEIVESVSVRTILEDENGDFLIKVDMNEVHGSITEQRHRRYGRCYTYHPEQSVEELGIYYVKVQL